MSLPDFNRDGVVRHRRDQFRLVTPGLTTTLVAPGDTTGGEFGLFECVAPPGSPGAIPHYHQHFTESFFVLEGRLAVRTGDTWTTADSGDIVHVPRMGIHAFHPAGDAAVRFLILFTPGVPRERYFADMAALHDRDTPPTEQEIDAIAAEHDQINLRNI